MRMICCVSLYHFLAPYHGATPAAPYHGGISRFCDMAGDMVHDTGLVISPDMF